MRRIQYILFKYWYVEGAMGKIKTIFMMVLVACIVNLGVSISNYNSLEKQKGEAYADGR